VLLSSGQVSGDPGNADVAIDGAGNALAVWREVLESPPGSLRNAVWGSRYTAGGAWSARTTIDRGVENAIDPRVALNAAGVGCAAFAQVQANVLDLVTARFDGVWLSALGIETANGGADSARVALGADNAAVVAFRQADNTGSRIRAARTDATGTWVANDGLDLAAPSTGPELALTPAGTATVTWVQNASAASPTLWSSRFAGTGWSSPVLVTPDSGQMLSTVLVAADGNGDVTAVWCQRQPSGRLAVRSARLPAAAAAWTAAVTLDLGQRDAFGPQVAASADGSVFACWTDSLGIWARRWDPAGATWTPPLRLQAATAPPGALPWAAVDASGRAFVVWLQPEAPSSARYRVWSARWEAGAWGAPVELSTDPDRYVQNSPEQRPVIAMNAAGDAVLVWAERQDTPAAFGIRARVYR